MFRFYRAVAWLNVLAVIVNLPFILEPMNAGCVVANLFFSAVLFAIAKSEKQAHG